MNETRNLFLSLHYNGANSHLFVNSVQIYKFKANDSEINTVPLCLGNVSKDLGADNAESTRSYRYGYDFSADYDSTDVTDNLNINEYLMVARKVK